MGNRYVFITGISQPQAEVGERRPQRFPRGTGTLRFPPPPLHQQPTRTSCKKTATATSRIEKEQVENAFCLRVGSKMRERIYLRH